MNNRGNHANIELMMILIGIILAATVGLMFLQSAKDSVTLKTLERNYVARDLALVIEAVMAAPGELEYNYEVRNKLIVDVENDKVLIRDKVAGDVKADYPFIPDSNVKPLQFSTTRTWFTDKINTINLTFSKKSDGSGYKIDVIPHNAEVDVS